MAGLKLNHVSKSGPEFWMLQWSVHACHINDEKPLAEIIMSHQLSDHKDKFRWFFDTFMSWKYINDILKLECGTWYHHPRRLQCVLSRNLRIFKVATWHYRCRHNIKNSCIWDNLQYCLLVPRSSSKPVMLTIDLQSQKVLFIEIVFWHV